MNFSKCFAMVLIFSLVFGGITHPARALAQDEIKAFEVLPAKSINGTDYSDAILFTASQGFASALVTLSGAVSTTITVQCSYDGTNWYDPIDENGSSLGTVCSGITTSKFIQFPPVVAKYIRFKIVTAGAVTVTIDLMSVQ